MVAPKLRFDGFDSDWTLGSIGAVISNKSKKYDPEKSEIDFPCIELEHLSQQTGEILGTVSAKDQKSIKNVFDENSVLFGKLRPYLRKFAKPEFQGVCSSEIWVLTSKKMQPNFLFQYVQTDGFSELTQIQAGSKMPRADWGSISNGEILFPIFEEQTKIASFLSAVDEKISQLSQKHQLLSQYKQGMMQKLFGQQIRFKADDGSEFEEWEEKQLGDVCHFINGRAYKQTEWEKEGTPVIRLQNLTGSGKEYYYSTLNLPDHQYCYNNDLLYMWSATFGPIFWQGEKAIFHYHIWKVEVEPQQLDKQYMYYLLDEMTEKMKSGLNGSTMLHVTKQGMESTKKNLPSIEEQTKIANFLSAIDQKIDVVSEQLEQAKLWKKGLLQQMFV